MYFVDINCDCGEEIPGLDDKSLMPFISSCNIACGGHAGSLQTMEYTIQSAKENRVRIGAHPGYEDRKRFGRYSIQISPKELHISITQQLKNIERPLNQLQTALFHVKAHGALYHDLSNNGDLAQAYLEAIFQFDENIAIYAMAYSKFERMALKSGFTVIREGFADRRYKDEKNLVPRDKPNAILESNDDILNQIKKMIILNQVETIGSDMVMLEVDTICIHGDHPNSDNHLKYLYQQLPIHQINIRKY